jgi:hypothetical protein
MVGENTTCLYSKDVASGESYSCLTCQMAGRLSDLVEVWSLAFPVHPGPSSFGPQPVPTNLHFKEILSREKVSKICVFGVWYPAYPVHPGPSSFGPIPVHTNLHFKGIISREKDICGLWNHDKNVQ